MLTAVLIMCSSVQAFAAPELSKVDEGRQKYSEIESKISSIQTKIDELNAKIEPLQDTINNNEEEKERIKNVIDNTEKDIEQCKKEITELDDSLGKRVNEMYKSGNLEFSYLSFILDSDSTGDFFSRLQSLTTLVGKDKKAVESVLEKREELDEKINSLETKKTEIEELTEKVKEDLAELDDKKSEQEELAKEATAEKEKFDSEELSALEREEIKTLVSNVTNENSDVSTLESAITSLRSYRDNKLKSEIIKAEANEAIEKGKALVEKKKQEAAAALAQASANSSNSNGGNTANRGNNSSNSSSSTSSSVSPSAPSSAKVQAVLDEAYNHSGKWYEYGATGPNTFDCSGFTQYVYKKALKIDISRTTYTQINQGTAVSQSQLQPGDLVFPNAGHVGIYIGGGQMIHAPHTGAQIQIANVYSFYAARRIV